MRTPPLVVSRRVDFRPRANFLSRWKYGFRGLVYAAVSENVRQVLISAGVDPSRVVTIHSGIPLGLPDPGSDGRLRRELGIGDDRRIVVSVAAFAPHKDHGTLLEAAARVTERIEDDVSRSVQASTAFSRWQAQNVSARLPGSAIPLQSLRNHFGSLRSPLATLRNQGLTMKP